MGDDFIKMFAVQISASNCDYNIGCEIFRQIVVIIQDLEDRRLQ